MIIAENKRDAMLARCDVLQRRIAAAHFRFTNDILSLAVSVLSRTGGYAHWTPSVVAQRLGRLQSDIASLMRHTFTGLIVDGHKAAIVVMVAGSKRRRATEADDSYDDPPVVGASGVVGGDDDERAKVIDKMKLAPLSREDAHDILYSKNPWGMTWEEQLAKSSRLVSDPAALADELAKGVAEDESLSKLRKRIEPFVENLSASAQRIARTEGLRIGMTAQQRQYDAADARGDFIKGMRMHCACGPNSAPDHIKRDKKFYKKAGPGQYVAADGEPYPGTPYGHPNCMCYGSPEFELT